MMLGKRSHHLIRKVSELLVFGDGGGGATALLDTIGSPKSPLDHIMNSSPKVPSPKGLKSYYDVGGAVGLGIVVALDKSEEAAGHKHAVQAIKHHHHQQQQQHGFFVNQQVVVGSPEDYTYVTYHEPNKTITEVYYDGGEEVGILRHGNNVKNNNVGVIRRNTTTTTTTQSTLVKAAPSYYPTSDFLSSCHLCRKKLHGKDIYMYRGEKAFCSTECRSRQIMIDEGKEQCRSEASMTVELSSSPYTRDQMFSTGIVAL